MSRLEKLLEQRNKLNKELHDLVASEPGDYTESVDRTGLEERMFKYQRDKDKAAVSAQRDARKAKGKGQIAEGILGMADALSRVASSRAGGIRSDKPIDLDMESYFKGQQERKYEDVQEALSEEDVQLRKASSALRKQEEGARQKGTTTRRQLLAEKRKEREDLNEQIRIAREQESEATKSEKTTTKKTKSLDQQLEKDRQKAEKEAEEITKPLKEGIQDESLSLSDLEEILEQRGITRDNENFKEVFETLDEGRSSWGARTFTLGNTQWDNDKKEETKKVLDSATIRKTLQKALLRDMLLDKVRAGNPINPARVSGLGLSLEDIKSEAESMGYEVTLKGNAKAEAPAKTETTQKTEDGEELKKRYRLSTTGEVVRLTPKEAAKTRIQLRGLDPEAKLEEVGTNE